MMQKPILQLGRYDLMQPIGKGGMGEVYRAILNGPAGFQKEVAVKLLHESVSSEKARKELVAEARLGGMFKHINLVEVQDLGSINDRLFVVMEMVDGVTLKNLIRQRRLTPQATLEIALQVCSGLDYAHKLSVGGKWLELVHCDLKPSNILISNSGIVKIADFGIAHAVGYTDDIDGIRGTPSYMSPEQTRNDAMTAQSDIFSLGLCLFEAFVGRKLLRAKSLPEMAKLIRNAEKVLIEAENVAALRAIHPQLLDVLRPCLYADPKRRYTSVSNLQRRLSSLSPLSGTGVMGVLHGGGGQEEEVTASDHFALSDRSMTRGNLPPSADLFIGREQDVDRIVDACQTGSTLLTLQGPGGVGKTQLAIQAAYHMSERFTGGLWFIDLSEATSLMDIVVKTADKLSIPLVETDADSGIEVIANALKLLEHNLLVFDNFEQIIHLAPKTVGYWANTALQRSSTNVFVVTSQMRLGIRGETVIVINPLSEADGVFFLQQRLNALGHQQNWTEQERGLLKEIVVALDGLPLALEMIASRLRLFTIEQIHERLQERFKLLQDRSRDGRHNSIFKAIEWSWSLLSDAEQSVLMQLSCFRGGFLVDDAEAIVDIDEFQDASFVMDVLEGLLDRSLLIILRDGPRFSMLRSIFDFATQKLSASSIEQEVFRRHAQRYAQWSNRFPEFYRHGGEQLLVQLYEETPNIRIAFERAVANGWSSTAADLALVLAYITKLHGPVEEGVDVLERTLVLNNIAIEHQVDLKIAWCKAALSQRPWRELLDEIKRCRVDFDSVLSIRNRVELLIVEARIYAKINQMRNVRTTIEQAIELSEQNGFRHLYAKSLVLRTQWNPQHPTAHSDLQQVIALMKQDGNLLQLGTAWFYFGQFLRRRRGKGDFKTARKSMYTAQRIAKTINDRSLDASVSMSIANLEVIFGKSREAEKNFQRSYELNRRLGRLEETCLLLGNMASWCIHIGKIDRGWRMLKRAKRILDGAKGKAGFRVSKMVFTANTAIILNIRQQFGLALPYAELAWKLSDADTQQHLRPFVAIILLEALVGLGRMEDAQALWCHFDCSHVDDLDGHGQIRVMLQRGLAASLLGDKAEGNRIARAVYDLILEENLEDLEVHYEYNKLIRLLFNMD